MMRFALALVLQWLAHCVSVAHSQGVVPDCSVLTRSTSVDIARNSCGCNAAPVCGACLERPNGKQVTCVNGCEYCDKSKTICGTMGKTDLWTSPVNFSTASARLSPIVNLDVTYFWNYTEGRSGSVEYRYNTSTSGSTSCSVQVNGQSCSSCKLKLCMGGGLQYEPDIDCVNLQPGALAVACNGRSAGGPVSVDEAGLSGILSPLAYPYLLCQWGSVVLANGTAPTSAQSPMKSPIVAPTKAPMRPMVPIRDPVMGPLPPRPVVSPMTPPVVAPTQAPMRPIAPIRDPVMGPLPPRPVAPPMAPPINPPVTAPVVAPTGGRPCGVWQLGIFCFRGCGVIRRVLGLCT